MKLNLFTNALFLCFVNITFMIAGIFLNSVVIISLWRSPQLRKKPCYFIILVLSCIDLVVVVIVHPVQIVSAIFLCLEEYNELYEHTRLFICVLLHGFSMLALLTLNIERFFALTHPIFHRKSVTKERLLFLLRFMTVLLGGQIAMSFLNPKLFANVLTIFVWLIY